MKSNFTLAVELPINSRVFLLCLIICLSGRFIQFVKISLVLVIHPFLLNVRSASRDFIPGKHRGILLLPLINVVFRYLTYNVTLILLCFPPKNGLFLRVSNLLGKHLENVSPALKMSFHAYSSKSVST